MPKKEKKLKPNQLDPWFKYSRLDENALQQLWSVHHPRASGIFGKLHTICSLIESLAHLRGFDPSKWELKSLEEIIKENRKKHE